MNQMEHLLNVYVAKAAKNSVAEFLGYCNVTAEESNRSLTEGLWLVRLTSWMWWDQNLKHTCKTGWML
jgi:hypothetical protein